VDPRNNGYVYIKDLRKVRKHGYMADEIVIIDDSPEKLRRQPNRHIHVIPFQGDTNDRELLSVLGILRVMVTK